MRMRRKKHLEERLDNLSNVLFVDYGSMNSLEAVKDKAYFDYKEIFNNENPVHLEIGCGKGKFVCEIAKRNPDINYIAVEKNKNVIMLAGERAKSENLDNVIFICCGAEYLEKFLPDKSIELIYLNFSCPYPKGSYARHRLTHERFLGIYKILLSNGGKIYQKTDNRGFFEFSLESFSKCGYLLENISLDLHNSSFEGNIETEYEERFASQGFPIYRLEAIPPKE